MQVIGVIYDPEKTGALVKEAGRWRSASGCASSLPRSRNRGASSLRNLLGKVDALWMLPDETVVTSESLTFLLLTAFKHNLPVLTISDAFVEAGPWPRSLPIIRMRAVRRVSSQGDREAAG